MTPQSTKLRISGGTLNGRSWLLPRSHPNLRPTRPLIRKSLYSILNNSLHNKSFIDLCCGSGIVGVEALSYGAQSVIFVDSFRGSLRSISQQISSFKSQLLAPPVQTFSFTCCDYLTFLDRLHTPFDVLFWDPPYDYFTPGNIQKFLSHPQLNLIERVFIEHPSSIQLPNPQKTYKHGNTTLSLFSSSPL